MSTDALAINLDAPCWLFQGALFNSGYGALYLSSTRKTVRVHRYMWEQLRGPIPKGMTLDHLCKVRHCLNPQHMEIVTAGENSLRGDGPPAQNARKTHCVHGHPFDEANTYTVGGARCCRQCSRDRGREWYRQKNDYYTRHPRNA